MALDSFRLHRLPRLLEFFRTRRRHPRRLEWASNHLRDRLDALQDLAAIRPAIVPPQLAGRILRRSRVAVGAEEAARRAVGGPLAAEQAARHVRQPLVDLRMGLLDLLQLQLQLLRRARLLLVLL